MAGIRKSIRFLVVCSIIAFAIAAYFFLWAISSADLAFVDCNGTYSLHAESFRCRRPVLLTHAFWAFSVIGTVFTIWTLVRARGGRRTA